MLSVKWSYTSLPARDTFTYTSIDVIATAWVGTHLPQRIITNMDRN
jgi:hypothetical protein